MNATLFDSKKSFWVCWSEEHSDSGAVFATEAEAINAAKNLHVDYDSDFYVAKVTKRVGACEPVIKVTSLK